MKAAVLEAFNQPLSIVDVDVAAPADDEILIRVVASGVCHSDRTMQESAGGSPLPQVLGHEAAGVVERVGAAVTGFGPGDHVVTCPSGFCGMCEWCMRGRPQLCLDKGRARPADRAPRLSREGTPVGAMAGLGAFAEQMLVHARAAVRIPEEMPLDRAALLGCAVMTGMGSVFNCAKVAPGETVAVIGCGGVGLNAIQAARFAGAARVVAIDRIAAKLDRAREFGATDVVDATAFDSVDAVRELTGGGVDHAIEVVGRGETIEQAFAMLRNGGTATVVGVAAEGVRVSIPPRELLMEKRLQGTQMGSGRFRLDVPLYCRLYLDGRIKLDELLSTRIDLGEVNQALDALDDFSGARSVIGFPG
jgi:S-(hydroxymethyl)glutathione dehydrogenase/alcohol dehydrogenase